MVRHCHLGNFCTPREDCPLFGSRIFGSTSQGIVRLLIISVLGGATGVLWGVRIYVVDVARVFRLGHFLMDVRARLLRLQESKKG